MLWRRGRCGLYLEFDTTNPNIGSAETMFAAPVGGAIWPQGSLVLFQIFRFWLWLHHCQAGDFSISVYGTVVCTDNNAPFDWSLQSGTCTDLGGGVVASSFINYPTGKYSITFYTAPPSGASDHCFVDGADVVEFPQVRGADRLSGWRPDHQREWIRPLAAMSPARWRRLPNGPSAHGLGGCNLDGFSMRIGGPGLPDRGARG